MWYDDSIKIYSDMAKEINLKYCNDNKYDFIYDNTRRLSDRKPHWERIPLIQKILDENNYDYVVWIDSDAFFRLDNSILLEDIITKYNKDIIFSADVFSAFQKKRGIKEHSSFINSGIFILKNTMNVKKILNFWSGEECFNKRIDQFQDQGCIRYSHKINIYDLKNISVILPVGILQSFDPNNKKYNDSLIIHLAGKNEIDRVKIIKEFKTKYQ